MAWVFVKTKMDTNLRKNLVKRVGLIAKDGALNL
jgi:hypothetical protein